MSLLFGLLSFSVVLLTGEQCLERVLAEIAPADKPFVVLLDHDARRETDDALSFGKPTTSVRRPISRLTRSSGFVERSFAQRSAGKA